MWSSRERTIKVTAPESEPWLVFQTRPDEFLGRVQLELLMTTGANARVEFRVRADTVELWHSEHLNAVFDRDVLGEWLHDPDGDLVVDEARLSVDWSVDTSGRVALTLPDVDAWTLSPTELDSLYRRVVVDAEDGR